jgi:uncharacterized membrane protein YqgA involved in biofilm formation
MNNAQTHNQSVNPQQKGTRTLFAMFGLAVLTVAIAMLLDSPAQPQAWFALIIAVMTGSCAGYASHTNYRVRSITQAPEKARNAYPTLLPKVTIVMATEVARLFYCPLFINRRLRYGGREVGDE